MTQRPLKPIEAGSIPVLPTNTYSGIVQLAGQRSLKPFTQVRTLLPELGKQSALLSSLKIQQDLNAHPPVQFDRKRVRSLRETSKYTEGSGAKNRLGKSTRRAEILS